MEDTQQSTRYTSPRHLSSAITAAQRQQRLEAGHPVSIIRHILRCILIPAIAVAATVMAVITAQWGANGNSASTTIPRESWADLFTEETTKNLFDPSPGRFFFNLLLAGFVYFVIVTILNEFWVSTALFCGISLAFAVTTRIMMNVRAVPLQPADLTSAGTMAGGMKSFIPARYYPMILTAIGAIGILTIILVLLRLLLGKCRLIWCSRRRLWICLRILFLIVPALILYISGVNFSRGQGLAYSLSDTLGISNGASWDSASDAWLNGPWVHFYRYTDTRIMDRPAGYSRDTMSSIAARYTKDARNINKQRTTSLTDQSVVFVLSESYSDPQRVPGVKLNKDPLAYVRSVKNSTTSGLMLSEGYGGGTAQLEYQSLTGAENGFWKQGISIPYQQVVPRIAQPFAFNQLWPDSEAIHPYSRSGYQRNQTFKKFGLDPFYTLFDEPKVKHADFLDKNPYVSDKSAYQDAVDALRAQRSSSFIQLTTIQNHAPYSDWYANNEFVVTTTGKKSLKKEERHSIQTYAKGLEYTDEAVKEFLAQLDALDKPVTVVWYGDHLPGIYTTANSDRRNKLALHETDYFIWSNSAGQKLMGRSNRQAAQAVAGSQSAGGTNYSSPNYFMAQAAAHMNARVTPYLAFLTEAHAALPAMQRNTYASVQGPVAILDQNGRLVTSTRQLTRQQKRLIADYRLIQYDLSAGKGYLRDTGFLGKLHAAH